MKRLLWKEHRECWLYGLALVISSMLIVAIGTSYTFQGHLYEITGWSFLPVIISAVMGASTLSREKENHSLESLVSRSISMDKIVLAKALLALSYSIVAAFASLVVFLIACRVEYRQFVNLHDLVCGVAVAVGFTSLAWYYGFGLSIYPRFETNLHMLLWISLAGWMIPLFASDYFVPITRCESWSTWVLMITPLLVIVLHRHCRWNTDKTPMKSGFIAIMVLSGIISIYAGKIQLNAIRFPSTGRQLRSVSPDGSTALFLVSHRQQGQDVERHWQFVDLTTGRPTRLYQNAWEGVSFYDSVQAWVDHKTAIIYTEKGPKPYANIIDFSKQSNPVSQVPTMESGEDIAFTPSANGDFVIYADFDYSHPANMHILDVRRGKWLTKPIKVRNCWWQSDRSVGYIDAAGKRRILSLPGGKGCWSKP